MTMTAPFLRLLQTDHSNTHRFAHIRMFVLGFVLVTCSIMNGCGSGENAAAPPTASTTLAWDPVDGVHGYYVYYGTESQGSTGSCSYPNSVFTSTPSATVTGLEPNTTYYFAVTAYNGLQSECSGEVATVTNSV